MSRPLLIFAKAPVAGSVKTRLIPALGAEGAQQVYLELLERTLRQTSAWPGARYLYCSPDTQHPWFAEAEQRHGLILRAQRGGDLGERMCSAISEHPSGALLIGTDCPGLRLAHLQQADAALDLHDVAILPSEDGGYVLIAQCRPDPSPFRGMTWSHNQVLADSRTRITQAGLSLWLGPVLWDVDEPEHLQRYRAGGGDLRGED